jgi:manganese/zinc/iron transport system permease protein
MNLLADIGVDFNAWLGDSAISFWIVLTGILVNIACAVLGCFLVLRRMSLLGDAISHAILPGLALGFIVSQSRSVGPMLIGALAAGLLTAMLTQTLHRFARVPEDAAMGVIFTSLFAAGVLMIHHVAHDVDLDPGCVLYGAIEFVPLDMNPGDLMPRATFNMGVTCLGVILFVVVLWKELKISAFDPDLATSQGFNSHVIYYLLMSVVATVTVVAFESVGSILVVAMLIVPAATASMMTDRLGLMILVASLAGVASAVLGQLFASEHYFNTHVSGMMSVVAGALFVVAVFVGPRHGVLVKKLRQLQLSLRIVREDVLALLYRWHEMSPNVPLDRRQATAALGGGILLALAVWFLKREGRIVSALTQAGSEGLMLTDKSTRQAQTLVKSHRLWETYLEKVIGLPPDHLHAGADRTEHFISEQVLKEVARAVDNPHLDPHGRPIPHREGSRVDLDQVDPDDVSKKQ